MQIRVDDISPRGRTVEVGLQNTWARNAVAEALEADPTTLEAEIRAALAERAGDVEVHLGVRVEAPAICDRCGEDIQLVVEIDSDLLYQPESTERTEEEVELAQDDLDVGWYRDGNLSLPDILMEAVALELPSRVLCTDEEACEARTQALLEAASEGSRGHPAFAALKNLKNSE